MQKRTANVEALAIRARQDERRGEVDGDARERDDDHDAAPDVRG